MNRDTCGSASYHPLLWWTCIGSEKAPVLKELSSRVFSLLPSSAVAERSFKVRSRVQNKAKNRRSNEDADMQSSLIYNTAQFKKVETGVLACERGKGVENLIILSYERYRRGQGYAGGDMFRNIASVSDNGEAAFVPDIFYLDGDEPGAEWVENLPENIDSILDMDEDWQHRFSL